MKTNLLEHFQSLRFKIAIALFVVLTLSIGIAMYGTWSYERGQFIDMANEEAWLSGRLIEKTLRNSMMTNDRGAIRTAANEITAIHEPPSRISIINPSGRVTISSDPAMRGKIFDRFTAPSCIACHRDRTMVPEKGIVLLEARNRPVLRNVIKIENEPQCHRCHPASENILGILIYDTYLSKIYVLLKTVAVRMLLTGLFTFLAIGAILWVTIEKFIHMPIRKLMEGFTQVGKANFDFWVDEDSSSEFGYMTDQFNIMSRAIGRFIMEIKAKNQETAILYTIVREISETIEWDKLQKIIVELVLEIFEAERDCLVVPNQNKKDCFDIVWRVKNNARLSQLVYCLDSANLSLDVVTGEELAEWHREKYLSHQFKDDFQRLLIPLHYNKRVLGLICVMKASGQRFSKHERAIVPALANHVSIAMANSHLYHLAITDGLTDLYSKRHLLNKLDMMVARHEKYANESFFLLILDIDNFKEVNDSHGHEVGDQVLVQLAEVLQKHIRFEDMPFRYGGEEFVILVPTAAQANPNLGLEVAERLRVAVENQAFKCRNDLVLRQTITVGVALFPLHGKTAHEVISAADEALYQAKESGKNQVRAAKTSG
jgi:diguanylate cyclase (GGDEF)-like protein